MNNRLKQFLSAENISQSQFADTINVVRASVSHVLSGRNNPSYDFIKATMASYPRLNIEWLIFGKGKMYRDMQETVPQVTIQQQEEVISSTLFDDFASAIPEPAGHQEVADNNTDIQIHAPVQRKVKKVIILYDDDTYQEL